MLKKDTRLILSGRPHVSGGSGDVMRDHPTRPRVLLIRRPQVRRVCVRVTIGEVSDVRCNMTFEDLAVPIHHRVFHGCLPCYVFRVLDFRCRPGLTQAGLDLFYKGRGGFLWGGVRYCLLLGGGIVGL